MYETCGAQGLRKGPLGGSGSGRYGIGSHSEDDLLSSQTFCSALTLPVQRPSILSTSSITNPQTGDPREKVRAPVNSHDIDMPEHAPHQAPQSNETSKVPHSADTGKPKV